MARLILAHSPDADDVAMWWPLAGMRDRRGRRFDGSDGRPALDTGELAFETLEADIQELNVRAIERSDLDITAVSAGVYPRIASRYRITRCGASIGVSYGPKLVVARPSGLGSLGDVLSDPGGRPVAIPGRHTTAYLVLRALAGREMPVLEVPFQEVIGAVTSGRASAGLLIHEAQLDPESLGLRVIVELGPAWTARTGGQLPLGLNVVRRDLDERLGSGATARVATLLRASVRYSIEHGERTRAFLQARSDDRPEWRDRALLDRYLGMYVNGQTVDMGEAGVEALRVLYAEGSRAGLCEEPGPIDAI
jgi:1,4-dihydroxy-6-naphthoate synthase